MKTGKQLKEEYRMMKFRMGAFGIVNKQNGKILVGSSTDLASAWNSHQFRLKAGMHENAELQRDWNAIGAENFSFEILEEITPGDDPAIDNAKEVKALEALLIEAMQPFGERGYNRPAKR